MQKLHNSHLFVSTKALQHNFKTLQAEIGPAKQIMVMVKANGYGTDALQLVRHLLGFGITCVGVAHVSEAIQLRLQGVSCAIFVLHASIDELDLCVQYDLDIGVDTMQTIEKLQNAAIKNNAKCRLHLHVNTGMSRFGCHESQAVTLAQKITDCPNLILEGIMTHFSCADDPQADQFTLKQHTLLLKVVDALNKKQLYPKHIHASNSSASLRFSFSEYSMARIGLALYGIDPTIDPIRKAPSSHTLQPALTLTTTITSIQQCQKEDPVSYGATYKVRHENTRLAVLPIGYYDGIHRSYSGKAYVVIHGKKAPFVGMICMDFMMVDITNIPEAKLGDTATIFGPTPGALSIEAFAALGNTIPHELMTCLGPRIARIFT